VQLELEFGGVRVYIVNICPQSAIVFFNAARLDFCIDFTVAAGCTMIHNLLVPVEIYYAEIFSFDDLRDGRARLHTLVPRHSINLSTYDRVVDSGYK